MISEERYARFNEKRQQIDAEIKRLSDIRIKPNDICSDYRNTWWFSLKRWYFSYRFITDTLK
ncbi:hypothetical protein ACVPOS_03230 [Staphylococcus aureus]